MSTLDETEVATARSSEAPVLELDDIGKSYGNVHALRGVNIKVRQGEVTCVLGDNGAGKSTLIKIIAGLHDYTEGTMKVNGEVRRFTYRFTSVARMSMIPRNVLNQSGFQPA